MLNLTHVSKTYNKTHKAVDDISINNMIELKEYIYSKVPGDNVSVNVSRGYITRSFDIFQLF